jgi:hypothetical protein
MDVGRPSDRGLRTQMFNSKYRAARFMGTTPAEVALRLLLLKHTRN